MVEAVAVRDHVSEGYADRAFQDFGFEEIFDRRRGLRAMPLLKGHARNAREKDFVSFPLAPTIGTCYLYGMACFCFASNQCYLTGEMLPIPLPKKQKGLDDDHLTP
jgi:hypothetical protein